MKSKLPEYETFKDLAAAHKQGDDYDVETRELSLDCVFVAPHGKAIEPETEFIARELAGDDFSFHVFEGRLSPRDHNLHITSHRYDEPKAIDLVQRCRIAVGIHGRHSKSPHDEEIWMGGLNRENLWRYPGSSLPQVSKPALPATNSLPYTPRISATAPKSEAFSWK
jgi:phage replication-related protein YjqB (UPF0714/DUF867 family)